MRQPVRPREHPRRGNAATILIVALHGRYKARGPRLVRQQTSETSGSRTQMSRPRESPSTWVSAGLQEWSPRSPCARETPRYIRYLTRLRRRSATCARTAAGVHAERPPAALLRLRPHDVGWSRARVGMASLYDSRPDLRGARRHWHRGHFRVAGTLGDPWAFRTTVTASITSMAGGRPGHS